MALMRLAVIAVMTCIAGTGCTARPSTSAFDRGRDAARSQDWDTAVRYYERALTDEPDNVENRIALARARLAASRSHLAEARTRADAADVEAAIEELEIALRYDPTNRYARDELEELREQARQEEARGPTMRVSRFTPFVDDEPVVEAGASEPLHIVFPEGSSLRTVLGSLAELAGVSILFDETFQDKQVAVDLDGVTYRDALDILMETNGLFYKVLNSSTMVVLGEN